MAKKKSNNNNNKNTTTTTTPTTTTSGSVFNTEFSFDVSGLGDSGWGVQPSWSFTSFISKQQQSELSSGLTPRSTIQEKIQRTLYKKNNKKENNNNNSSSKWDTSHIVKHDFKEEEEESEEEEVEVKEEDDSEEEDEEEFEVGSSEEDDEELVDEEEEEEGDSEEQLEGEDDDDDEEDGVEEEEEEEEEEEKKEKKIEVDDDDADDDEEEVAETDEGTFSDLNLSRPILKAINNIGYVKPTPIQKKCIPIALEGRDLFGSAVTGSGKTAAFVLPILERLLYRPKRIATTRVLILNPTRELAAQCYSVVQTLAKFTDIRACLAVGGLSSKEQETALRERPDIVIGTPGRVIDHILNSRSFGLDDIEILVLDEADRLLDMGFADELKEIVKACPKNRQTMLFSATMTKDVEKLVDLSLNNPARIFADALMEITRNLQQEFIRIKAKNDGDCEAILLAICTRTFKQKAIVFVNQKVQAHRLMILFGLAGMTAAELHGNMQQVERLSSLEKFRDGKVSFLIATDVAARGLDIIGTETVINFNMPVDIKRYIHRVGRTARAGRSGRSVSFITDRDRKMLKAIVKHAKQSTKQRVVPQETIALWKQRIDDMEEDINDIAFQEKTEKLVRRTEMEAQKAVNLVEHEQEIYSRPARTWFQTNKEKEEMKSKLKDQFEEEQKDDGSNKRKSKNSEKDQPKQKKRKVSRMKRREQKFEKLSEEKHGKVPKLSEKEMSITARHTKKEEMMQRAGLLPKQKKSTAKEKRIKGKQLKQKAASKSGKSARGGFGEESRRATLGKLKGKKEFKSKSRYKRR